MEYLKKCSGVLRNGGYVVVKENLSTSDEDVFDEVDSSVTRYVLMLELTLEDEVVDLLVFQNG